MKKIGFLLCLLLTISIFTISCGKDIPEGGDVPTGPISPVPVSPPGGPVGG